MVITEKEQPKKNKNKKDKNEDKEKKEQDENKEEMTAKEYLKKQNCLQVYFQQLRPK